MFFLLYEWNKKFFNSLGLFLLKNITFRSAAAAITALFISFYFGPKIIRLMKSKQIGEQEKKELAGVGNHAIKAGTPTMGGIIVLLAVLVPTLLWANISNWNIILIMATTAWIGMVGFLDDYLKVIKKYPKGLIARYKLIGQISIGLLVGLVLYFHPEWLSIEFAQQRTITTIPFIKDVNFDFQYFYIPVIILIITYTSNAVNLTDGLDGLCIGTVGISALAFAIIAYVTGNAQYAKYLDIFHLPGAGELTIFCAALVGASLGFLWFNSYPAQIFMGDTGALALGGALGCISILIKKEFLLPILGGIFFIEIFSVVVQVTYFKYTKKKFGSGKRVFLMTPIHHHFEKLGWHESKIVVRFYILAVMLAIIAMTTFKVR
ncbi:MAG: phospho-N-acetylmuramoyl-pentapeptide-transferase [Candidatus Kapabacteria bacterium]|nr:phospho-N-acetylmuramoyl-pentapeptide-transferase [Candidatus Kapabacteria bacterium]